MEDVVKIVGGKKLKGKVKINGSKNSTVALIPAALLAKGVVEISNVPKIEDVNSLLITLEYLNVKTKLEDHKLTIDASKIENKPLIGEELRKVRASYYFMGALLALFKEVKILEPGGCKIGERPIDIHLDGFKKMGVDVKYDDHVYTLKANKLYGKTIVLRKVSVGATINLMLAMSQAEGISIIENAAKEPEIVDVANLINAMNGIVKGAGSSCITIVGSQYLKGTKYQVIPDRIETGTYAIIGAALAKEMIIENCNTYHCKALLNLLHRIGANMTVYDDSIIIKESSKLKSITVETNPYPGFPTDLQQPLTTLLTQAEGESVIRENIYQERTAHVIELIKMGAKINVVDNSIVINGPTKLTGAHISGKDLRGGASLVLASLIAEGESELSGFKHIKRGYDGIVNSLNDLGADIKLIAKEEISDEEI